MVPEDPEDEGDPRAISVVAAVKRAAISGRLEA